MKRHHHVLQKTKQKTYHFSDSEQMDRFAILFHYDMALLVAFSKFDPGPFSTVKKKKKKGPIKTG